MKSVYVEAKKSKNFQTYTVGMTIEEENPSEETIKKYQAQCRKLCMEQIKLDTV